jgi:hypothetical protein
MICATTRASPDNAARVVNREATDALVRAWTRTLGKMEVGHSRIEG